MYLHMIHVSSHDTYIFSIPYVNFYYTKMKNQVSCLLPSAFEQSISFEKVNTPASYKKTGNLEKRK